MVMPFRNGITTNYSTWKISEIPERTQRQPTMENGILITLDGICFDTTPDYHPPKQRRSIRERAIKELYEIFAKAQCID